MKKILLSLLILSLISCASFNDDIGKVWKKNPIPEPGITQVEISNTYDTKFDYDFYIRIENDSSVVYEDIIEYGDSIDLTLKTGVYEFCLEYKKKNAMWWPENCYEKVLYPDQELYFNAWLLYTNSSRKAKSESIFPNGDPFSLIFDVLRFF